MPKKYYINPSPAPPRFTPIGKSGIVDFGESCLKCHNCVKKRCIYDVFKKRNVNVNNISDNLDALCKNCFRCVQECTNNILFKSVNPEYLKLGNEYYTPETIFSNWYQAETGKIPVSGAGYGGKFVAPGFDEIWTDMSEIVRPTRDGIHGREYISTSVDLGRRPPYLRFTHSNELINSLSPIIEIPIPFIFNLLPLGDLSQNLYITLAKAAQELSTFLIIDIKKLKPVFFPYLHVLIPHITDRIVINQNVSLIEKTQIVQLSFYEEVMDDFRKIKEINPKIIVSIYLPLNRNSAKIVEILIDQGAEIIHLFADIHGREISEENPRFLTDALLETHRHFVEAGKRDWVTFIFSGGIALAEHIAKTIICGADAVALDIPLLLALECRLCFRCQQNLPCPVDISHIPQDWGIKRLKNLTAAWRNQLLEILGAMGIREIRRLRGEVGRAIFFKQIEQETFGKIFGK